MEREFVRWLTDRLATQNPEGALGIGDDAAVIPGPLPGTVVATDLLCDGVHFRSDTVALERIGHKALAVNLSDFAAMGVSPSHAVVSLLWPTARPWRDACRIYEGMLAVAERYSVAIVGGDTNRWSGALAVNVALFGAATPHEVWRRDGAKVGDAICVTGAFGGSLLGHHLDFEPRLESAAQLKKLGGIHACMDVSDGLVLDLSRLVEASGCGAELDLSSIPIADAAHQRSQTTGRAPLHHALYDGEDFELLFTVEPDAASRLAPVCREVRRIGTIVDEHGVWSRTDAERCRVEIDGYVH